MPLVWYKCDALPLGHAGEEIVTVPHIEHHGSCFREIANLPHTLRPCRDGLYGVTTAYGYAESR